MRSSYHSMQESYIYIYIYKRSPHVVGDKFHKIVIKYYFVEMSSTQAL